MLTQLVQNSYNRVIHLLGWHSRFAEPYFEQLEVYLRKYLMLAGLSSGNTVPTDDYPYKTLLRETKIHRNYGEYPRFYLSIFQAPSKVYAVIAYRAATTPLGIFQHEPRISSRIIPRDQDPSKELICEVKKEAYRRQDL